MKNILRILLFLLSLNAAAQGRFQGLQNQLANDGYYRLYSKNDSIKLQLGNLAVGNSGYTSSKGTQIIANGNSITAGTAATTTANRYINIFAQHYGISAANKGIGGSVIDTFFSYTTPAYTSSVRYITMMWGVNEAYSWDTTRYHTAYKKAIDTLTAKGYPVSKIVILQATPVAVLNGAPFAYIDSLVAVEKGVRFVPLYYYCKDNGYINMLNDGVHPLDAGENFLATRIVSYLNDTDITGYVNTLNTLSTSFLKTSVLTANSGGFTKDVLLNRMRVGNNNDSTGALFGYYSGIYTTGTGNSYFGHYTGVANSTGSNNAAFGNQAGRNITGSNNAFFGYQAGLSTSSGAGNTAVGYLAGTSNTTQSFGTYVGYEAGKSNTSGTSNTYIGTQAGRSNSSGGANTALGFTAGYAGQGSNNVFFGYQAGLNSSNSNNTFIGYQAGVNATTASYNTTVGYKAMLVYNATNSSDYDNTIYITGKNGHDSTASTTSLVGVNTSAPNSTLHVSGSLSLPYAAKTTTYTITVTDHTIDCTTGTFTVTLPTAASITGREYTVKNTGAGVITLATTSSQTIDAATTYSLATQYKYVTVISNGANWIITANN